MTEPVLDLESRTLPSTRRVSRRAIQTEAPWYFVEGNNIHIEKVPRESLQSRPLELTLEADQQPFLLEGSSLDGHTSLFEHEGETYRKVVLSETDLTETAAFRVLGKDAKRIDRHASLMHASCAYGLFDASKQRESLEKFLAKMPKKGMYKIEMASLIGTGVLFIEDGEAIGAKVETGRELISGYEGMFAFMLLNAYTPSRMKASPTDSSDTDLVNQGFNSVPVEEVRLLTRRALHELNTPQNDLGNMMFNVTIEDRQTKMQTETADYAITIRGEKVSGLLVFKNGKYTGGSLSVDCNTSYGDDAMKHAFQLLRSRRDVFYQSKQFELADFAHFKKPASKSALKTASEYLSNLG